MPEGADPTEAKAVPRERAILLGVVIGSVLAVIAVLVMGSDGSSEAAATSVSTSTTAAASDHPASPEADVAGSISDDDGSPTTVEASSRRPTSAEPTTTTSVRTPTVVPAALAAPEAGRYPIKVVSSGREASGVLVVSSDGWQRRELGDAGAARTEQLSWSDTGARLVASGAPGEDGSCRWDGRSVNVPSDLRDGRTWSSRVTCDSEVDDHEVKVVRVEEATVTKRARTQLDGRSLDTWVIDRRVSVTIRADDFTTTSVSISTELFAPGLGLPVYRTSRTDVPLPDGSTQAVYASEEVLGLP